MRIYWPLLFTRARGEALLVQPFIASKESEMTGRAYEKAKVLLVTNFL
jgi:hypothetical protein